MSADIVFSFKAEENFKSQTFISWVSVAVFPFWKILQNVPKGIFLDKSAVTLHP